MSARTEICPFCMSPVNEGATVCSACGANKRKALSGLGWLLVLLSIGSCPAAGGMGAEGGYAVLLLGWILFICAFVVGRKARWYRFNA